MKTFTSESGAGSIMALLLDSARIMKNFCLLYEIVKARRMLPPALYIYIYFFGAVVSLDRFHLIDRRALLLAY
jgi:hypothetical protein